MIYAVIFTFLLGQTLIFDFLAYNSNRNLFWSIDFLILVFIVGFRWQVGGDSITYQDAFENSLPNISSIFVNLFSNGWEPGFVLLMAFCKSIVDKFWFFQLVHAVIVNLVIFQFLKSFSNFRFFSLLLYFIFNYLYFNTEVLREVLAVCIFLKMYKHLLNGNLKKYYLLNVFAIFFHYSSLVLLVIPFLSKIRFTNKNLVVLVILISLAPIWLNIAVSIVSLLPFADRVVYKIGIYLIYNLNINGTIYKLICFVIFPLILINKAKGNSLFSKVEILYMPFLFFGMFYVMYSGFGRLLNYFIPFMMIFLSQFIYMIWKTRKYYQVRMALVLITIIPPLIFKFNYYSRSTDNLYPNTVKFNNYYPYSNIWEQNTYDFRRIIYEKGMSESYNKSLDANE